MKHEISAVDLMIYVLNVDYQHICLLKKLLRREWETWPAH